MAVKRFKVKPFGCNKVFEIWVDIPFNFRIINPKNAQNTLLLQSQGPQKRIHAVCEFSCNREGNIKVSSCTCSPAQIPLLNRFGILIDRAKGVIFNSASDVVEVDFHNGILSGMIRPLK